MALGLAVLLGGAGPARAAEEPKAGAADRPAEKAQENGKNAADVPKNEPEAAKDAPDAAGRKRVGRTLRLSLPITSETERLARRFVDRALADAEKDSIRPELIFEFHVPAGQEKYGRGSRFGPAWELARYLSSDAVNAAHTVAYIPQPIQGHAVLVAIACDEIIMAPEATIGAAGIDEKSPEDLVVNYRQIAQRRRTVPGEVALGMLDPAREVLQVDTGISIELVTPEQLDDLRKNHTIQDQKVLVARGEAGQFTGVEAQRLGFASALASNRADVARALDLPAEAMEFDVALADKWQAARVDLRGPVTAADVDGIMKSIEKSVKQQGANFICLWIESQGGSPVDSLRLASYLAEDLDAAQVRTVAYVPREALADAAIVAMACDQVVVGPDTKLGGWGAHQLTRAEINSVKEIIHDRLAPETARSWSLVAALVDPNLEVYECKRLGVTEYFSDAERQEQPDPAEWKQGNPVTKKDQPLQLSGQQAVDYGLANHFVEDFAGFKAAYGLEGDPALVEPGWADHLVDLLSSRGVAMLLLVIGGAALYAEFHTPGVGVGGFIAFVCFVLFFWSAFTSKTAGILEVTLFVTGLICVLVEIFILPGFGIFGLGGAFLMIASLILATQTFILPQNPYQVTQLRTSLVMIGGAAVGVVVLAMFMNRWLPYAPVLGRIMLHPPSPEEKELIRRSESLVEFERLVGREGVTTTQLTPSGKARFGDELVDVISDVELIEPGTRVVVVEVHGSRVMVEPVDSA